MSIFGGNKLKEWAENNNLKYQEKIKFGFFQGGSASISNIIYGSYKGNKVYIFKCDDSTGQFTRTHYYFNGNFYSKIKPEDIDQLLADKNYLKIDSGVFGYETQSEIAQVLVADIYLKSGLEVEHKVANDILQLLQKFYNSQTSFKDKLIGGLIGSVRSDIKYNSPEAMDFVVQKNPGLDRTIITAVANTYENLLDAFNQEA